MSREVERCSSEDRTTQEKILAAAAKIFACRGYREATTRMICNEAGVNVALVNYYFRSKAELYKAVVGELFKEVAAELLELPGSVVDEESWKAAMRGWVRRSLAICAAVEPPESYIAQLMGMEAYVPPEVRKEMTEKFAVPISQAFTKLLKMGLGEDDTVKLALWHSTIKAQSVVYAQSRPSWMGRYCPEGIGHDEWLDMVADHLCRGIFACLHYEG